MSDIYFVGDICADSYSLGNATDFQKSPLYELLKNNYTVGNLEAPVLKSPILENKNKFSLINSPDLSPFYDVCNLVSLSNNHVFDQGLEGFNITKKWLDDNAISFVGAGDDLRSSRCAHIIEHDGVTIGFLGYNCYSTNASHYAEPSSPGTAPLIFDYIRDDIAQLKRVNDDIKPIVLLHWGVENEFQPTSEQTSIARKIIDLGVEAIIGTHPHVIQSFEFYHGKPIYYSQGNFVFNDFEIGKCQKYYQTKFNKQGMIIKCSVDDGQLKFSELFFSLDKNRLPVIEREPFDYISVNNEVLSNYTNEIDYHNSTEELSLSLKFNGKNMQVVYGSDVVHKYSSLTYETLKSKIKRLVMYRLRKLL